MIQDRIPAGGNLLIDNGFARWRLVLVQDYGAERVLLEAEPGQPIRLQPAFAADRGLPDAPLAPELIGRVAVGWSPNDKAWHIGFVLEPALAESRGGRWVELAHFPDSDSTVLREVAARAGQRLADVLNRPFTFIPPKTAVPVAPPIASPAPPLNYPLPIKLTGWTLIQRGAAQFDLVRNPGWTGTRLLRVLWYLVLAGVFVLLAVVSLTSGIALPRLSMFVVDTNNPAYDMVLVIGGFVCAAILVLLAFATLIRTITAIKRVNIDGEMRQVREMRGNRPVFTLPAAELDAVYASVVVSRFNNKRPVVSRKGYYGELSLRDKAGEYMLLSTLSSIDDPLPVTEQSTNVDEVIPLTTRTVHTPVHAAALYIARALDIPARLDQRIR